MLYLWQNLKTMRKINFIKSTIIGGLICSSIQAQNDLVVFNNDGEKFYLYVNGVKQNANYETNVRVTNINQPWVKVKIVFEDNKRIPDLTKNVQFVWEGEQKRGWEFVYQIVNKKGKYQIKPYSAAEISNQSTNGQTVVNYSTQEPVSAQPAPNINSSAFNTQNGANVSQTVATTTIVSSGAQSPDMPANGSVGISLNVSPTGANIQIHDGTPGNVNSNTGYTTSVVSSTVVTSTSNPNTTTPATVSPPKSEPVNNCVVNDTEFEEIKKSIASKSFEDSKLTLAKQISNSKCLKSSQVRDIMKIFSYEDTRLEFAKYAYQKVIDKDNYYLVNDAFQYESSIDELNESIGK